jgi:hypothetical protein
MLRITIVRLLADIVNRTTLISKQKMYLRRQPQGDVAAVTSAQWSVVIERKE